MITVVQLSTLALIIVTITNRLCYDPSLVPAEPIILLQAAELFNLIG